MEGTRLRSRHGNAGLRGDGGETGGGAQGGGWGRGRGWNGRGRGLTSAAATVGTVLFCDVSKVSRATSAMVDVLIDEQEMPEPVRLRAICVVSDEWEKLGRIRHQRTT